MFPSELRACLPALNTSHLYQNIGAGRGRIYYAPIIGNENAGIRNVRENRLRWAARFSAFRYRLAANLQFTIRKLACKNAGFMVGCASVIVPRCDVAGSLPREDFS